MTRTIDTLSETEPPTTRAAGQDVSGLQAAASAPGVDPCDVVCGAIPGLICKDLPPSDIRWIDDHLSTCAYCENEVNGYRRIETALDACCNCDAPKPPPVPWLSQAVTAWYGAIDSPVGPLLVAVTDKGVCEIDFAEHTGQASFLHRLEQRGFHPVANQHAIAAITDQLEEFFSGKRNRFEVPLDFSGVTPFTQAVLNATNEIPFGRLSTYQEIAQKIGQPKASRAVGNALGRNPLPIIVPCHRIVRADASIGGYTGGLQIKRHLLKLEGADLMHPRAAAK